MQRGALFWLFGTLLVILDLALILFTVGLVAVAVVALLAWLFYTLVTLRDVTAYGNLFGSA